MITSYLTDIIDIITDNRDENGVLTTVNNCNVKARVADDVQLLSNQNGNEFKSKMVIMLPVDTNINDGDKVRIKTKAGNNFKFPDKKFKVMMVNEIHTFTMTYTEVWI